MREARATPSHALQALEIHEILAAEEESASRLTSLECIAAATEALERSGARVNAAA